MNATEIKKELANARQNLNNALAHIQAVIIAADEKDNSWIGNILFNVLWIVKTTLKR